MIYFRSRSKEVEKAFITALAASKFQIRQEMVLLSSKFKHEKLMKMKLQ